MGVEWELEWGGGIYDLWDVVEVCVCVSEVGEWE